MKDTGSILPVEFNENTHSVSSRPVYQYDHGLSLCIYGIGNLAANQIHYAVSDIGKAQNVLAKANLDGTITADIPDILLQQTHNITAYLYVENETSGYTAKTICIPMIPRSKPESISADHPSMGPVNELATQLRGLIDEVNGLKSETTEATSAASQAASKATTAASSANTATTNANNAANSANEAANKLNDIRFEVNPEDGCLYMYMP